MLIIYLYISNVNSRVPSFTQFSHYIKYFFKNYIQIKKAVYNLTINMNNINMGLK